MRLVYFGSGAFGLPTLQSLIREHLVALVVPQPDRPAGRRQMVTPTPIAAFAERFGIPVVKPLDPNEATFVKQLHAVEADAYVVIAYGHKLSPVLLGDTFAINLHASLLPKYRGAAPIKWAMINEERETGVSVISLAQRMDAGDMYATRSTPIRPTEIADELEQRLAELGPPAVQQVLIDLQRGALRPIPQDHAAASAAPKLTKADGTVCFDQPASAVRARINALNSWPGCTIAIGAKTLKILRADVAETTLAPEAAGTLLGGGDVACRVGSVRFLEVQPPGKRPMSFQEYQRGHDLKPGVKCENV